MGKIFQLLEDREKRVEKLRCLKQKYNAPCIFVRANYPGIEKTNEVTIGIVSEIIKELEKIFEKEIIYMEKGISLEGPYGIFIVNGEAKNIKLKTLKIEENHFLGRLVDIDIYGLKGNESISRSIFGKSKRKCYICSDDAHNCVRSQKHSLEEIENFIKEKWINFCEENNE